MNIAAYFYNRSLLARGGKMDVVTNIKNVPAPLVKAVVADFERGLNNEIMPFVWQSETCIGNWHYNRALYDQPGELADTCIHAISFAGLSTRSARTA